MQLAPLIGNLSPEEAVKACDGAETRYQRYSCIHGEGHAYMRLDGEQLPFALHACTALGKENAPDCAAGRVPRLLDRGLRARRREEAEGPDHVAAQAVRDAVGGYVRGCWYRALLERAPAKPIETRPTSCASARA